MKRVCVYCGSRDGDHPTFATAAETVGTGIAKRGMGLVYGAGDVGLMGRVATATMDAGGEVLGVIPQHLMDREIGKRDVSELIVVQTMRQLGLHDRPAHLLNLGGYWDPLITLLQSTVDRGFADQSFLDFLTVHETAEALVKAL